MRANPVALQPPPSIVPPLAPSCPQNPVPAMVHHPPIDKIRKCEYWLENTLRVFVELMCSPDDSLKCAISLLKDKAYSWLCMLTTMVPNDWINWNFF